MSSGGLDLDPVQVERFRIGLVGALDRTVTADERIALAVSGGPDSMVMLALAVSAYPRRVVAATVDHCLRADSADEAAMVARWCADHEVRHATLTIEAMRGETGNLHAWARRQRYALLLRWCVDQSASLLCTAHHADDQAETFLMRAARGSGVAGLAAVRARTRMSTDASVAVVRPLLSWRRQELRNLAAYLSLPFVDDPSNRDGRFERARVRGAIESLDWLDPRQLAAAAAHAADADDALSALTAMFWEARAVLDEPTASVRVDMADLPRELRRRLVSIALDRVSPVPADRRPNDDIAPLVDALEAGGRVTQRDTLASAHGTVWHFRKAPPRR